MGAARDTSMVPLAGFAVLHHGFGKLGGICQDGASFRDALMCHPAKFAGFGELGSTAFVFDRLRVPHRVAHRPLAKRDMSAQLGGRTIPSPRRIGRGDTAHRP